jgi:CRISPR-associated protein Cmr3
MSQTQLITFEAVDTLMFRDGRPFNQSDAGASRAVSVFPPHPPTIVGAVRAALWEQSGVPWNKEKLGNGTNWQDSEAVTLGPLRFGAPLLLRSVAGAKRTTLEPLLPVPLHLVEGGRADDQSKTMTFLAPSETEVACDLGASVHLPVPKEDLAGIAPIEDRWVTLNGMKAILDQRLPKPEQLVKTSELWRTEPRVGIGITEESRITDDGRLYMASHIRIADDVRLGLNVTGADQITPALQALAGEHRMALMGAGDATGLPKPPGKMSSKRYCVVQISPLLLNSMPAPGEKLGDLPGVVVSACLGKLQPIGGWDSVNRNPIPLRKAIPSGSVWFMELADDEVADWSLAAGGFGLATEWGFGQFLIGNW